eukprot:m51a1_g11881 hypothetical protein (652) ;mRNA; f:573363-575487
MGKRNKGKRQGQLRTQLKTEKKDQKRNAREAKRYEDDIDRVLSQIARSTGESRPIPSGPCARPSARAHCSLVAHPSADAKTLVMWGGELCASKGRHEFYRDTLKFRTDKRSWASLGAQPGAPCPLPRCSHQAVGLRYGGRDLMYLFGGEFSTPDGEKFRHFRDTWCLDLESGRWEEVLCPGKGASPTARSGHRMTSWKKQLVLFGGYFDSLEDTRYMNDLWLFDLEARKWTKVDVLGASDKASAPAPRSGCQLAVYGDWLYVFGGYSRELRDATADDDDDEDDVDRTVGVIHNDVWRISLPEVEAFAVAKNAQTEGVEPPKWEKLRLTIVPPPRTGFCLATYKKRAFMFGGVYDPEDLDKESTFRNDVWSFNFEKGRWFVVKLRDAQKVPSPRYGSQCAVVGSSMYVWGGVTETDKAEYTFDDLFELNLNKLDGFSTILASTVALPQKGEEEKDDDDEEGDDSDDEEGEEEPEEDSTASESEEDTGASEKKKKKRNRKKKNKKAKKAEEEEDAEKSDEDDSKDFFMPAISKQAAAAAAAAAAAIEAEELSAGAAAAAAAEAPVEGAAAPEGEQAAEEEPLAPPEVLATRDHHGTEELEGPAGLPRAEPREPEPVVPYDGAVDETSDTEADAAPVAPQAASASDAPASSPSQ